jgi:hypothetical protein
METLFAEIIKGLFNLVYDTIQHLYFTTFVRPRIIKIGKWKFELETGWILVIHRHSN